MLQGPDIQRGPTVMALASLLPSLSEDTTHFSKSEIIKRLAQLLKGRDARDAASIMAPMANIEELREVILQSEGVISTLRGMLENTNSDAAAYVIGLLSEDDNVLEDLRKHDVAAVLIDLMNSENSNIAQAAGFALEKLARNPEVRIRIMEVVPGLVKKLRVEQVVIGEDRQAPLLALIGLAADNPLRDQIVIHNAVKPLVEMLEGPHTEDAANVLGWLSGNEDARKQIVALNAIPAIIQMLEGSGCGTAAKILTRIGSGACRSANSFASH
ncbi:hypothetical protein FIBSPDRAFT_596788 [Athelia psychrophila]|uniref:ARM repeat-containing protein n=1 Tax=Athelia psychrophila TaxID=1759441 RepID=A0A166GWK8_9AGAM|nr:hypothetical protein FIBSPDRAFT_596788 [Fibularhizoctonia sp. CBS 109695]